jgi:hypothetical protein
MLHGKIETRVVKAGRKPPFPLGRYLIYTTKKAAEQWVVFDACGPEMTARINSIMKTEPTAKLNGYAIAIGTLSAVRPMVKADESKCFIGWSSDRWCLVFTDVQRIEPFQWEFGKQGIGFVPDSELSKIKPIP